MSKHRDGFSKGRDLFVPTDKKLQLPGRDFQLPGTIGEWSPFQLNEYIRSILQNDPTMLPAAASFDTVTVKEVTIQQAGLPLGNALIATDEQGNGLAVLAGITGGNDVAINRALGSSLLVATYDRVDASGGGPAAGSQQNHIFGGPVYIPYNIDVSTMWNWPLSPFLAGAATAVSHQGGIYGPVTPANVAAVPLLCSGTSVGNNWVSASGPAKNGLSMGGTFTLEAGSVYFLVAASYWTGTATTPPGLIIRNRSGTTGVTTFAQSFTNFGVSVVAAVDITGTTALPSTIDVSTTGTTPNLPWLALT